MKRLLLATTLLSTPAAATDYVMHLDTGYYGAVTGDVTLDLQTPTYAPSVPVTVTPLPPAIWLFATGLAGLALMRRKR